MALVTVTKLLIIANRLYVKLKYDLRRTTAATIAELPATAEIRRNICELRRKHALFSVSRIIHAPPTDKTKHKHTRWCTIPVLLASPIGTLRMRLKCTTLGTVDNTLFSLTDNRISDEMREELQWYPDINNVCLLTRALEHPLSVWKIIKVAIIEYLERHQEQFDDMACALMLTALKIQSPDLLRLLFVHFVITDALFRQKVFEQSDRSVGAVFLDYARSALRQLYATRLTPQNVKLMLHCLFTTMKDHVLFKRTMLMKCDVSSGFVIPGFDTHHFEPIHPLPPMVDSDEWNAKFPLDPNTCKRVECPDAHKMSHWEVIKDVSWRDLQNMRDFGFKVLDNIDYPTFLRLKTEFHKLRHDGESTSTTQTSENIKKFDAHIFSELLEAGEIDADEMCDDVFNAIMSAL